MHTIVFWLSMREGFGMNIEVQRYKESAVQLSSLENSEFAETMQAADIILGHETSSDELHLFYRANSLSEGKEKAVEHHLTVITIQYQDASRIEDLELQAAVENLSRSAFRSRIGIVGLDFDGALFAQITCIEELQTASHPQKWIADRCG